MSPARRVLVLTHVGREAACQAGVEVVSGLVEAGVDIVVPETEWQVLRRSFEQPPAVDIVRTHLDTNVDGPPVAPETLLDESGDRVVSGVDAVIVLGGDGTILRAAELVRGHGAPLVGVNLGHFGFLAQRDATRLSDTVARVTAGDYAVDERMTVEFTVHVGGRLVHEGWALNEVTLEKASRERMVDVILEIEGRPLTRFGCDGVVLATPTGSTAYAFSAGGPVVWPGVEALLVTPIAAHALFARPLVVQPDGTVAVETMPGLGGDGLLVADGRRHFALPPAARVEVRRGRHPVRLARFGPDLFTERLVNRFQLPVAGWRGPRP